MKIRKSITVLAVVLYIAIIYFSPASYINKPKNIFIKIVKSPLGLASRISYKFNNIVHSKYIAKENMHSRLTVNMLTRQLLEQKEIIAENERLRRLLNFKKKSPLKLIASNVIAKDPSNLYSSIIIDQGLTAGIKKDTTAISGSGLVGRVSFSSPGTSRVILITDPNSRVSAIISRSRQLGMVYGTSGDLCKLHYLPLDADIQLGDMVVTSGFSEIYPKGLLIGNIVKIIREPRGMSLSALVEPAVDLSRLEEVSCIE